MKPEAVKKYRPFPRIDLSDRVWPSQTITKAPIWCSVDLRDGNQALIQPMSLTKKLEMFKLLVDIGFKEIEVGFPSASQVEYDFTRTLIDKGLIPEGVLIQVVTQARAHLIEKTFSSLKGVREAVVHLYNSTSVLQRRTVFKMNRMEIIALAVEGAKRIKEEEAKYPETHFRYEYSPESFTGTELEFALEICEAVMDVWRPTPDEPVIINLPATVELASPNVYADQIQWFSHRVSRRDSIILSLHAHNDRGCAVAATELGLLAGGQRVEGTLFGNGERTGNVDIITLALNMFTQGVDPGLDLHDINQLVDVYERVTHLPVHPRHPYAGELVYTAFSGSHQDAINKGMTMYEETASGLWEVPYLTIDPTDVGRTYESIIRINSQSGKGGVAYVMDKEFGFKLPREMHPEFGAIIQDLSEREGRELQPREIYSTFEQVYLSAVRPFELKGFNVIKRHFGTADKISFADVEITLLVEGQERIIRASGNGPLDAFCSAMKASVTGDFTLCNYHEHALNGGSSATAAAYIEIEDAGGNRFWGIGIDTDIIVASIKAVMSALNRSCQK